jgi:hypothetical protein
MAPTNHNTQKEKESTFPCKVCLYKWKLKHSVPIRGQNSHEEDGTDVSKSDRIAQRLTLIYRNSKTAYNTRCLYNYLPTKKIPLPAAILVYITYVVVCKRF